MAAPKRRPDPEEPDLSSKTDFQILDALARIASKEASTELLPIVWEVMRRYTSSLADAESRLHRDRTNGSNPSRSEDPKWGDCKAVEARYGLKRGVIYGLIERNEIVSASNSEEKPGGGRTRGKLVIAFESVEKYLNSRANGKKPAPEHLKSPEKRQFNRKDTL